MWWPSQLLKHRPDSRNMEQGDSFFSFTDQHENTSVPARQSFAPLDKTSTPTKPQTYSRFKHVYPRRFFTGHSFAKSTRRKVLMDYTFSPCSTGEENQSSDGSVVIIGRTASFERSLLEKQSTLTSRLTSKVRGHQRKNTSTSLKGHKGSKNRPHMPFACYAANNNGAINPSDVEDFMLDLDEAWHPNGYSLEDHTDFLIEMTKTAGTPGQVTVIGRIDNRRPADRVEQHPAPLELAMHSIDSPFSLEDEDSEGYLTMVAPEKIRNREGMVEAESGRIAVGGESRLAIDRFLSKSGDDGSGCSSPASISLLFPCHERRRSREFGSDSIKFVKPDEVTDLSEVYIHLGSISEIEHKFKAKDAKGDAVGQTPSLPRSISSNSSLAHRGEGSRSDKLHCRSQIQGAIHITTLEASPTEDSGWFKLARPRQQSWADFSQTFAQDNGSNLWKQYDQAINLPLPEPSFLGMSAHRIRAEQSGLSPARDSYSPLSIARSNIGCETSPDGKRPASPVSRAILDSAFLDDLTAGALPVLSRDYRGLEAMSKESISLAHHPFSQNRSTKDVKDSSKPL